MSQGLSQVVEKIGPEPRIPFLYNNTSDAIRICWWYVEDFARIGGAKDEAAFSIKVDKWTDSKGFVKRY